MKRWNHAHMLEMGKKLFAKIQRQKTHAHHNHDVHFMAKETRVMVLHCADRCHNFLVVFI